MNWFCTRFLLLEESFNHGFAETVQAYDSVPVAQLAAASSSVLPFGSRRVRSTESYACTVSAYPLRGGQLGPVSWKEGDPTRAMTLFERGADLSAIDYDNNNVLHYLATMHIGLACQPRGFIHEQGQCPSNFNRREVIIGDCRGEEFRRVHGDFAYG
jgi:hypothetical protein